VQNLSWYADDFYKGICIGKRGAVLIGGTISEVERFMPRLMQLDEKTRVEHSKMAIEELKQKGILKKIPKSVTPIGPKLQLANYSCDPTRFGRQICNYYLSVGDRPDPSPQTTH
jgi:hypothetical protein